MSFKQFAIYVGIVVLGVCAAEYVIMPQIDARLDDDDTTTPSVA